MPLHRRTVLAAGLAMIVPGVGMALEVRVFVAKDGQPTGPYDEAGLRQRIRSRAEAATTLVWHQGMADWAPATQVPALAVLVASLPAETPVDFGHYILGTWTSNDSVIPVKTPDKPGIQSFVGRSTWIFTPDNTYKISGYAERLRTYSRPLPVPPGASQGGQGPVRPALEFVDESVRVSSEVSGTYRIVGTNGTVFTIELDGRQESVVNSEPIPSSSVKSTLTLTMVGPDHMRTAIGENLRRRPF